jgi:hypothetical protein
MLGLQYRHLAPTLAPLACPIAAKPATGQRFHGVEYAHGLATGGPNADPAQHTGSVAQAQ